MSAETMPGARPRLPGGFRMPPFGVHQWLALVVVAIALWALGALWLALGAADQWIGGWREDMRLHVYLDEANGAKGRQADALARALAGLDGVAGVRRVSPAEAARRMREWLGRGVGLTERELRERLPLTFELSLDAAAVDEDGGAFLFDDIRDLARRFGGEVNEAEMRLAGAHRWLGRLERMLGFAALVAALAMALIISNTLRMLLLARADEIHLMRLLGAREWFVRMPFVIEGAALGAGASALAWLLEWPLVFRADDWLAALDVSLPVWSLLPALVVGGALTGCLGALIATARVVSPDSPERGA